MLGHLFSKEENKMIYDKENKDLKQEVKKILEENPDKAEAVLEAIDRMNTANNQALIDKITADAEKAAADQEYKKSLNLRNLSENVKKFYEFLKTPKQAITAEQIDILPTELVDYTLANVKKNSRVAELITYAPGGVKKWYTASKSGKARWGKLDDSIIEDIEAVFETLDIEVGKMFAAMIIPKAIRDLSLEFIDVYITAILNEIMNDGIEEGYFVGTGKDQPIGIFKKVDDFNADKTAKDKAISTTITGFAPKQLAPVKKYLSNGGLRQVSSIFLVCNPEDNYEFVEPALYGESVNGEFVQKSKTKIEVIESANCPKGKAAFTLKGLYTMGFSGIQVNEYKETKALDDANLLIAKVYGNGRAVDNNVAYVFDPSKLEEYVPKFQTITGVTQPTV